MTESNAYLAYGITVTTESLLYAVAAWPRLQGPFAFLDLVALRKRQGTLAARHSRPARQGVQTVPVEVWDVVRHKLVDVELRAAEVEHVKSLLCDECQNGDVSVEILSWADLIGHCGSEMLWEFEGLAGSGRSQAALDVVSAFGLALPTLVPIRADPVSSGLSHAADPKTATLISLPGPSSTGSATFGLHASCGGDMGPDEQAIVDVSLSIPPDAKQRFRRLVSTMHLQPVYISDGMVANAGTGSAERAKTMRRAKRKFKEISLEALRPGWKLMTMAETTW